PLCSMAGGAGRELRRPLQVRLGLRRWRCRRGPGLCGGAWHPPVRGCFRGRRGCAAGLRRLWFASPHRDRTGRQGWAHGSHPCFL
ncbi:hypothetical protein AK812_SmicGene46219, partial [Symbiodinium microadriaticum]